MICIEQMISVKNVSVKNAMYLTDFFMTKTFLTDKMHDLYRTNDIDQKCHLFDQLFYDRIIFDRQFLFYANYVKNSFRKNPRWSKKVGQSIQPQIFL